MKNRSEKQKRKYQTEGVVEELEKQGHSPVRMKFRMTRLREKAPSVDLENRRAHGADEIDKSDGPRHVVDGHQDQPAANTLNGPGLGGNRHRQFAPVNIQRGQNHRDGENKPKEGHNRPIDLGQNVAFSQNSLGGRYVRR